MFFHIVFIHPWRHLDHLCLGCCTWCCKEHWSAVISSLSVSNFFRYMSGSRIPRSYFSFFEKPVAAPVYIPTKCAQGFPFLHLLAYTCSFLFVIAILTGMRCYPIVVLTGISLMINDVEHLFMYLLAIYMSSLKISIQTLGLFFTRLFAFLLLSCVSYLHVLTINP